MWELRLILILILILLGPGEGVRGRCGKGLSQGFDHKQYNVAGFNKGFVIFTTSMDTLNRPIFGRGTLGIGLDSGVGKVWVLRCIALQNSRIYRGAVKAGRRRSSIPHMALGWEHRNNSGLQIHPAKCLWPDSEVAKAEVEERHFTEFGVVQLA